jgi:hypothetical protein
MPKVTYLAFVLFLTGCVGYTRQGLYDAAPVEGWRLLQNQGTSRFLPLSPRYNGRGIIFGTPRKGELFMRVYFPTEGEVKFESQHLRIIPHDGGADRLVPISIETTFAVPDTEFSIVLPSFTVGGERMPSLRPRFRWRDRTYRIIPVE